MDIKKIIIKKHYLLAAKYYKKTKDWASVSDKFSGKSGHYAGLTWRVFGMDDELDMLIHIDELYQSSLQNDFSYLDKLSSRSLRMVFRESIRCLIQYYFDIDRLFHLIAKARRGSCILDDILFRTY